MVVKGVREKGLIELCTAFPESLLLAWPPQPHSTGRWAPPPHQLPHFLSQEPRASSLSKAGRVFKLSLIIVSGLMSLIGLDLYLQESYSS